MIERIKHHFDSAHRLSNYDGKCRSVHGHRWDVEVIIKGHPNKKTGMIVDFNRIKKVIDTFDHRTILKRNNVNLKICSVFDELGLLTKLIDEEPTVENLVYLLYKKIRKVVYITNKIYIKLWESPGCCAEYGDKIKD